jgi:SEC-C motif domain protein
VTVACECGIGESTEACCGRFFGGQQHPATAEELMRSRYTAFASGEIDYIMNTHHPRKVAEIDRRGVETWSKNATWHSLEILSTHEGGPDDERGEVEFVARYSMGGFRQAHQERAEFERSNGRWYYVDGKQFGTEPVRRDAPRVGRNDACPCGSGKKFKKCCGRAA